VLTDIEHIVIFITASSDDEAQRITKLLLEQRKVACINIVSGVDSRFWWKGKIDSARESLLVIKTRASVFQKVMELVKTIHSYEVPEIIALPIIDGNDDYLKWIDAEVKE
jgi:periplasmic divalent cation tolerance protein